MKRRDFSRSLKITSLIVPLIAGCAMTEERGKDFYDSRIESISKIEVTLRTVTKVSNAEEPQIYEQEGNGFVVGHYLISRDHVTSRYAVPGWQLTPYGPRQAKMSLNRKSILSELTYLDDIALHPVAENPKNDIAIFDLSKTPKLCEKYCNDLNLDIFMKGESLYRGMKVYWMGSPGGRIGFYRESQITKLRDEKDKGTNTEHSFMLQDHIIPGTSGKPIWSGNKIVGISHYVWKGLAGIGFMGPYLSRIKKYENDR